MRYTITNNATMAVQSTRCETAGEALRIALELQATGHRTLHIVDETGAAVSIETLEARDRQERAAAA